MPDLDKVREAFGVDWGEVGFVEGNIRFTTTQGVQHPYEHGQDLTVLGAAMRRSFVRHLRKLIADLDN